MRYGSLSPRIRIERGWKLEWSCTQLNSQQFTHAYITACLLNAQGLSYCDTRILRRQRASLHSTACSLGGVLSCSPVTQKASWPVSRRSVCR